MQRNKWVSVVTILTVVTFAGRVPQARADNAVAHDLSDFGIPLLAAGILADGLTHDGKARHTISKAVDASIGELAVTELLKSAVHEQRPNGGEHSFPSGHAAGAFALAKVMADSHPKWKGWSYGLAAGVAWSRVDLRAHHGYDVAAGALIGVGAGYLADRGGIVLSHVRW